MASGAQGPGRGKGGNSRHITVVQQMSVPFSSLPFLIWPYLLDSAPSHFKAPVSVFSAEPARSGERGRGAERGSTWETPAPLNFTPSPSPHHQR